MKRVLALLVMFTLWGCATGGESVNAVDSHVVDGEQDGSKPVDEAIPTFDIPDVYVSAAEDVSVASDTVSDAHMSDRSPVDVTLLVDSNPSDASPPDVSLDATAPSDVATGVDMLPTPLPVLHARLMGPSGLELRGGIHDLARLHVWASAGTVAFKKATLDLVPGRPTEFERVEWMISDSSLRSRLEGPPGSSTIIPILRAWHEPGVSSVRVRVFIVLPSEQLADTDGLDVVVSGQASRPLQAGDRLTVTAVIRPPSAAGALTPETVMGTNVPGPHLYTGSGRCSILTAPVEPLPGNYRLAWLLSSPVLLGHNDRDCLNAGSPDWVDGALTDTPDAGPPTIVLQH